MISNDGRDKRSDLRADQLDLLKSAGATTATSESGREEIAAARRRAEARRHLCRHENREPIAGVTAYTYCEDCDSHVDVATGKAVARPAATEMKAHADVLTKGHHEEAREGIKAQNPHRGGKQLVVGNSARQSASGLRALSMEMILRHPHAKEAFLQLTEEKVPRAAMEYWLLAIGHSDEHSGTAEREWRKRIIRHARDARALAQGLRLDINFRRCPVTATPDQKEQINSFVDPLRRIADTLNVVGSWRRIHKGPTKRNENISYLLQLIDNTTGSFHYAEVVALIGGLDAACGRECDCSEGRLRELMRRQQRHMSKILGFIP